MAINASMINQPTLNIAKIEYIDSGTGQIIAVVNYDNTTKLISRDAANLNQLSLNDFISANADINDWTQAINVAFQIGPRSFPYDPFALELKTTVTSIELKLEINSVLIIEMECDKATDQITVQPRPASSMNFNMWLAYTEHLTTFINHCR